MKDSNHRENAKMDVPKDAEPAAFEHEKRRLAGAKHGLGRRRISDEQRQEILNELFFEGEEADALREAILLAAHDFGLDCNHRPV
jgi:hypothetical protein